MDDSGDGVYTISEKSILLDHDYSGIRQAHNNNIRDTGRNRIVVKKFQKSFDAVDKWTDSVILRVQTGDDRKKIVEREITILKVKYPFLPEQQIRGKVYKKFGIPAVMGGVLSRYNVNSAERASPKDHPERHGRNPYKTMDSKNIIQSQNFPESADIEEIGAIVNKSDSSDVNEKPSDAEANFFSMSDSSIDSAMDANSPFQDTSLESSGTQNCSLPLVTEKVEIQSDDFDESHSPVFPLLDSEPIVSPLILDESSINHDDNRSITPFSSATQTNSVFSRLAGNSHRIRSPSLSNTMTLNSQLIQCLSADSHPLNSQLIEGSECFSSNIATPMSLNHLRKIHQEVGNLEETSALMHVPRVKIEPPVASRIKDFQQLSPRRDSNENFTIKNSQSIAESRRKRKLNGDLQSTSSTQSINLENTKRSIFITEEFEIKDEPCEIIQLSTSPNLVDLTIGTTMSSTPLKSDCITLDHSYSGKKKNSRFFTQELEDWENENESLRGNDRFVKKESRVKETTFLGKQSKKKGFKSKNENFLNKNIDNSRNKENKVAMKRLRRTIRKVKMLQNSQGNNSQFYDTDLTSERLRSSLENRSDNDSVRSVEITSPVRKKRRISTKGEKVCRKLRWMKNDLTSNRSRPRNLTPEVIDLTDDKVEKTINKSSINLSGNSEIEIIPVTSIPWRADLPLFIMIDALSNHCCEKDHKLLEITKLDKSTNNFGQKTETCLKNKSSTNVDERFEITDTVNDILAFLDKDCQDD